MKVGFIGTGRMGQAMVAPPARRRPRGRRLQPHRRQGQAAGRCRREDRRLDRRAARYGDAVFTMLADDAALEDVVNRPAACSNRCRRAASMSAPARTASPPSARSRRCTPSPGQVAGRRARCWAGPELVTAGRPACSPRGPADALAKCRPLFEAIGRRTFEAGADPEAADRHEDRQQFRARLRHRGDGRGLRADPQIRRRHRRVLRRDDRRPVQLLGLQDLRQDHGGGELLPRSARWPRSA